MSSLNNTAPIPEAGYWRSLAELNGVEDPNLGAEFLPKQLEPMDGETRRRFLQIMGASVAMAGAVGCSRQHRYVVPAAKGIENRTIGQTQAYATAMELSGVAIGLLAQCYEGRPIRVDGNPLHPLNQGSVNVWASASILGLYDPDRSKTIRFKADRKTAIAEKKWFNVADAFKSIRTELSATQGEGLRILSEATSSVTVSQAKSRLLATYPKAQWIEFESVSRDNERLGTKLVFGSPLRAHFELSKAEIIVDLDADLLGIHPASLQYTRDFAANRNPENTLSAQKAMYNRLYCVESNLSATGGTADHRLAWRSSDMKQLVTALAKSVESLLQNKELPVRATTSGKANTFLAALARDLVSHKGKSVIALGFRHAPEVHAAVHELNYVLGNIGTTVNYFAAPEGDAIPSVQALAALAKDMNDGKVNTLVILNNNPIYSAPQEIRFSDGLAKVKNSVHVGLYYDETAELCAWHIPQTHYLESWGDARSWNGIHSIVQPVIEPLHQGKTNLEVISLLLGNTAKPYDLVKEAFKATYPQASAEDWNKALRDGVVEGSAWKPVSVKPATKSANHHELAISLTTMTMDVKMFMGGTGGESGPPPLEAVFIPDTKVYDGRFTNNAWLQELPEFITKLTWDNAILLSYNTAKRLNVKHGQMVTATLHTRSVKAAVFIQPGHADWSTTMFLGYGRKSAGVVGGTAVGRVTSPGFDFNPLRSLATWNIAQGLNITPLNEWYTFATTQEHSQIDTTGLRERDKRSDILIRSDTLAHYQKDQSAIHHKVHELPMIKLFDNPLDNQVKADYKWGMTIDLSKCTGCNACVIACQSENNIPVVGKQQVIERREMQWLRIDRYFHGDSKSLEDVTVVHQPMMCVHCENAPCEQVCPVAATVHSAEGTNDMVYNRCIGTRYCANNCPFKVRRFNFLNWHKQLDDEKNNVIRLSFNPDVTVRSRGVMEKCTYCIQRIRAAKVRVKNEGIKAGNPERKLKDGDVITACQQACPAGAITFGDLNNQASRVAQLQSSPRGYKMLEDLNVKPRTAYLARIRNPNPELEPTAAQKEAGYGHG
ncbi:MAG: Fe-S-cluster-containing hydrogenase [Planctomycetia bacterium]|nr:Fe-S-cluster-containing hydrogenase [Planctomycetia bacterium]